MMEAMTKNKILLPRTSYTGEEESLKICLIPPSVPKPKKMANDFLLIAMRRFVRIIATFCFQS